MHLEEHKEVEFVEEIILEEFTVPSYNNNYSNWKPSPKREYPHGIYIACPIKPQDFNNIKTSLISLGIKPIRTIDAHCTLILTKTPVTDFRAIYQNKSFVVYPDKTPLRIFGKGTQASPFALVLVLNSPDLNQLNKEYRKRYNLKETFQEYKPHITIAYDLEKQLQIKIHRNGLQKMEDLLNAGCTNLPRRIRTGFQYFQSMKKKGS